MKIPFVGAKLFYADRLTDRHDKANGHISQFGERASKSLLTDSLSHISLINSQYFCLSVLH